MERIGFVRSVRTPQFNGITFHEVLCKSALNKIPDGAAVLPFNYTVNGYRGCSHACRYRFARPTHEYLELDCGNDFDTQIIVKTNVADVLRRELHRRSWRRETVAMGTNTDPYQRAEGRYALMRGIIGALAASGTPLSIDPQLVGRYRELYRRGAYLPPSYRDELRARAAPLIAKYALGGAQRRFDAAPTHRLVEQPTLF